MFDTFDEALETNSECAFCHKEKFVITTMYVLDTKTLYNLERCADENCDKHCKWNHDYETIQLDLGGPDAVAIASGW